MKKIVISCLGFVVTGALVNMALLTDANAYYRTVHRSGIHRSTVAVHRGAVNGVYPARRGVVVHGGTVVHGTHYYHRRYR